MEKITERDVKLLKELLSIIEKNYRTMTYVEGKRTIHSKAISSVRIHRIIADMIKPFPLEIN